MGQNLAMLELRLLLATLVRRYEFSLLGRPEDIVYETQLTRGPKNVKMKVTFRD